VGGIALYTTPEVRFQLEPETVLVTAGVETDVLGIGRDDLPEELSGEVTRVHPRPSFIAGDLAGFHRGLQVSPGQHLRHR
jgi:hypothetical protein